MYGTKLLYQYFQSNEKKQHLIDLGTGHKNKALI